VTQVFILSGPTAAGKTALALSLADEFDAHIVSADAMTVYRGLDVGTAKPSPAMRQRHPHSCVDIRELSEEFSVADFCASFDAACRAHSRVLVVGGTPFYLSALLRPLADLPPANPEVRAAIEARGDLHATLSQIDPASAARLHPNDTVRLVRALEVHAITGQSLTALHAAGTARAPLEAPVAWMDRTDLRERIGARLTQMFENGYVEEVRNLVALGADLQARPLRSFAYRHLIDLVQGIIDRDEAMRRTERDTWRFARKQRAWARSMGWTPQTLDEALVLGREAFGSVPKN